MTNGVKLKKRGEVRNKNDRQDTHPRKWWGPRLETSNGIQKNFGVYQSREGKTLTPGEKIFNDPKKGEPRAEQKTWSKVVDPGGEVPTAGDLKPSKTIRAAQKE